MNEQMNRITGASQEETIMKRVKMIASFYHDIKLSRFAQLVGCTSDELEMLISRADTSDLYIKIDRPAGTVVFVPPESTDEVLNRWAEDMASSVSKLEAVSHLVQIERDIA